MLGIKRAAAIRAEPARPPKQPIDSPTVGLLRIRAGRAVIIAASESNNEEGASRRWTARASLPLPRVKRLATPIVVRTHSSDCCRSAAVTIADRGRPSHCRRALAHSVQTRRWKGFFGVSDGR
uniref:Uncharacterized protein n=1 Tax=Plectus sambesii TaxID=2011161 RepID=A0A914V6X2_9BILA